MKKYKVPENVLFLGDSITDFYELEKFKTFEQKVHCTRYRKEVWYGLNNYERFFAIPYFVFGSSLGVLPIYSFIHRIRKGK